MDESNTFGIKFTERMYVEPGNDLTQRNQRLAELRLEDGPGYEKMCGQLLSGIGDGLQVLRVMGASLSEEKQYRLGVGNLLSGFPGIDMTERQGEIVRDERGEMGLPDAGAETVDTSRSTKKFGREAFQTAVNETIPAVMLWAEVKMED